MCTTHHVCGADLRHEHDGRVLGGGVELSGVGVLQPKHVASELDDCDLQLIDEPVGGVVGWAGG